MSTNKVEWNDPDINPPTNRDLPIWISDAGATDIHFYSVPTPGTYEAWAKADVPAPYEAPKPKDYAAGYGELCGLLKVLEAEPIGGGESHNVRYVLNRARELGHI